LTWGRSCRETKNMTPEIIMAMAALVTAFAGLVWAFRRKT
jgi:hypothetical protein